MITLYQLVSGNNSLRYVDDASGELYSVKDLPSLTLEGDRSLVFAYLDNSVASVAAFWSTMRSKHVIALLAPDLNLHFKNELETLYKPLYIIDQKRTEIDGYSLKKENSLSYFEQQVIVPVQIHQEVKLLISTSGTTGSPKFVKLSEQNLIANALSICDYLPVQREDVTPLNLPIYYSYGLSVLTSNSIKGGRIICSNDDLLKKEFWEKFTRYGYTSFAGVPFVYEMLDRIGFTKKEYPSLRYFTQAGGKLQDPLVIKFAEYAIARGVRFYVMYGQTEATARMSYLPPERTLERIGSIGKPIKDGRFVIDEETAELCYKGPNVFGGYVTGPSELASYERTALLRTGDMAREEDGFYYITGRLKRMAKIFGNRVNLDEVESLLAKELHVQGRCVGYQDKQLLIFVTDDQLDLRKLAQEISAALTLHITAIKPVKVDEIPLTVNGKVNYTALIDQYATVGSAG
jgi:long-chain acyl-CoA synthetase